MADPTIEEMFDTMLASDIYALNANKRDWIESLRYHKRTYGNLSDAQLERLKQDYYRELFRKKPYKARRAA